MNPEVKRTFDRKGARAGAQSSPPCSFNSLMWPQAHPNFHHLKITKELSRQGGAPQHAAAMIDLSVDTIQRRAIPDDDKVGYVDAKIRFKELNLNPGKAGDRRYYAPDVLLLLKTPGCVRRSRT
jgi:hypothetical protein